MKKLGVLCSLISLVVGVTGCSYGTHPEMKKIVIEEDVREGIKEPPYQVEVEEVYMELPEDSEFRPFFYKDNEWYGSISRRIGVGPRDRERYPIEGFTKDKLYVLGEDNRLRETAKEVLFYTYQSKMIEYTTGENGISQVLSVDYTKEDTPKVEERLSEVVAEIGGCETKGGIGSYINQQGDKIYTIRQGMENMHYTFYNETKDILYTNHLRPEGERYIYYIESWDEFICIDENQQISKVVFGEDTYTFEPYFDLSTYVKSTDKTEDTWKILIDKSKMLFIQFRNLRNDGYFYYHPIREIESMGILDLETNQYDEFLKTNEDEHLWMNVLGNVPAVGGPMFILDSFDVEEGHLLPKTRKIQLLVEEQLQTLYEEDIKEEGKTFSQHVLAEVSEDGSEIFLAKDQTVFNELQDIEVSVGTVYKRYTFK